MESIPIEAAVLSEERCYRRSGAIGGAVLSEEFKIESYDKMLDGGICSRKRPDFVIDGLYRKLVIEVDEHRHRRSADYSDECVIWRTA